MKNHVTLKQALYRDTDIRMTWESPSGMLTGPFVSLLSVAPIQFIT